MYILLLVKSLAKLLVGKKKVMADYYKHESAIVDDGAQIGKDSRVWHFAHVCSGAEIGQGVSLGQNVFVGNKVTIGDKCKIQNNVSVYDNVHLEDEVFCGPPPEVIHVQILASILVHRLKNLLQGLDPSLGKSIHFYLQIF